MMTDSHSPKAYAAGRPSRPVNDSIREVYPGAVLNISKDMASVFQLKRKYERTPSMLDLTPPFQREKVWSQKQKNELIESIIMGIPIPVFYVKERNDGVYVVVDGKQRLTTLFDFIDNKFALRSLSILTEYENVTFDSLSPLDQNKIEDCTLTINVIKPPTSDRVTFDLFDRVNRGGTRLNNQEMRNALYQGNATRLIDRLAVKPLFIEATEKAARPRHMKDRLMVLRFIAFYMWREGLSYDLETGTILQYRSNIDDFLGKTMAYLNSLDENDPLLASLEKMFDRTMADAVRYILPLGGFRLPSTSDKKRRPLNMSFFESLGYLMAIHPMRSEKAAARLYNKLLSDPKYLLSITKSIDSINQINMRFDCVAEIFDKIKKV